MAISILSTKSQLLPLLLVLRGCIWRCECRAFYHFLILILGKYGHSIHGALGELYPRRYQSSLQSIIYLLPSCLTFQVIAPQAISVIGLVSAGSNGRKLITVWERYYNAGFILSGLWDDPQSMIESMLHSKHMKVHMLRVVIGLFVAIFSTLVTQSKVGFFSLLNRGLVIWYAHSKSAWDLF